MKALRIGSLMLLLVGCGSYQLPAPEDIAAAPVVGVKGRQGWVRNRISFGDYEAREIDRDWVRSDTTRIVWYKASKSAQPYRFQLAYKGEVVWVVDCAYRTKDRDIEVGDGWEFELESNAALFCGLAPVDGGELHRLELHASRNRVLTGTVTGAYTMRVEGRGTALFDNGEHGPTGGFYLRADGRSLAAVQTANSGSVRIATHLDLQHRHAVAAVAGALLILDESRREF